MGGRWTDDCRTKRRHFFSRLLSPVFLFSLLLIGFYTHFNADQLQYNLKLLRKAAARVRAANEAEKPAPANPPPAALAGPAQRKSPRLAAASA